MDIASLPKKLIERGRFAYHAVRSSWPLWYYILNRKPRQDWQRYRPALTPLQSRLASDLKSDGIAVAHIDEIFPDGRLFSELRSFAASQLNSPSNQDEIAKHKEMLYSRSSSSDGKSPKYKDFRVNLWGVGESGEIVDLDNPFLRFALDEVVLGVLGSYMGLTPTFGGLVLQTTLVVPPDYPEYLSQRWHRDPEDKKLLRIFMYLSDVDEIGAGPFTYAKGTQLGGKWRGVFPQRPPVGRYPPAGEVEKIIPREDVKVCLGRPGTVVIADTSGLHKGGYSRTKPRLMCAWTYFSHASLQPLRYRRPERDRLGRLSFLARRALRA